MTEEKTSSRTRHRIESLSDLIFGLALSIGALTLIGQQPGDFQQLLASILYYGFSFLILIGIWRAYTRTMAFLPVETTKLVNLNILLLFLVSIEPYLFNQLIFSPSFAMLANTSIAYAFDLGALFAVQTFFAHSLITEQKQNLSPELIREYRFRRNTQLVSAGLFFVSALPIFWSLQIPLSSTSSLPLRFIFWFIPMFQPLFRHLRKQKLED